MNTSNGRFALLLVSALTISTRLAVGAEAPSPGGTASTKIGTVPIVMVNGKYPDAQLTNIQRAASTNGARPWLLVSRPSQIRSGQLAGFSSIDVFLAPTNSTPDLRRGSVARVFQSDQNPIWTFSDRSDYAQVAVPNRSFDAIEGIQDLNRPFRVTGRFSDAELVSLVSLIRSSPVAPHPAPDQVEGKWPIVSIGRIADGTVELGLYRDDYSGQTVIVRREGERWMIVDVGIWIK